MIEPKEVAKAVLEDFISRVSMSSPVLWRECAELVLTDMQAELRAAMKAEVKLTHDLASLEAVSAVTVSGISPQQLRDRASRAIHAS